ncbi:hypothetical protein TD95_002957 [Thielaviopsis punctulata]|uniref:Large ribosomal subunit protein mL67 n=1 Tax=Thielaviopsis punctulata TaxID=72032 RepID=A0A0F4ZLD9_9PEZI|nr:hypothetical protein TD95_002957 [Thielaviopsis punctulata]
MNAAFTASRFSIGQLGLGVSRTSVRFGHTKPRWKLPRPDLAGHAPGHGEKIYIFTNIATDEIVYSHTKVLNVYKAFKQMPFAGKKNRPAKIRKDLWRQLAVVSFPEGLGVVGQSVFQRLREFRMRHFLEWSDDMYLKPNPDKPHLKQSRTRQERGRAIIAQKANSIADLAAVLAGAGAGTRMWLQTESGEKTLCPATVEWAQESDSNYAQEWTDNVSHTQMPKELKESPVEVGDVAEAEAGAEAGASSSAPAAEATETAPAAAEAEPKKKNMFSWGS